MTPFDNIIGWVRLQEDSLYHHEPDLVCFVKELMRDSKLPWPGSLSALHIVTR